jgi:putative transposase
MPRSARLIVPRYPHHIIQRGHNRQPVFRTDEDYLYYLDNLQECKKKLGCLVYAYCLMTNHVHLIVDPGDDEDSVAQLLKRVAGRQTRRLNTREKMTGSLWEGRYKSSPICTDEYLLACCRYVELNPVRAAMVDEPSQYRWSSYRAKVDHQQTVTPLVDYDPCYYALAETPEERAARYLAWVMGGIDDDEVEHIRLSLQRGQLTGSSGFVDEIEQKTCRRIEFRGQGRPKGSGGKNRSVPI